MPNFNKVYPLVAVLLVIFIIGFVFVSVGSSSGLFARLANRLSAMVVNVFDDGSSVAGENVKLITDPALAYQSNNTLKFYFPDQWHVKARLDLPVTKIANGDTLNFYIRTASSTYTGSVYLMLVNYAGGGSQSQNIDLKPYLVGGQVTTAYQLVSIPYSALGGTLANSFQKLYLQVPSNQYKTVFYIDKIFLNVKDVIVTPPIITPTTTPVVTPITPTTTTQIVLFDDFPNNLTYSSVRAINNSALSHSGSWSFEATVGSSFTTSTWLGFSTVTLKPTDKLEFYIRTKQGTYTSPVNIWLTSADTYSRPSKIVDLVPYLISKSITTNYQLVSIPMSAFTLDINPSYFTGSFKRLSLAFGSDTATSIFYLDDLNFLGQITTPPPACSPNWSCGNWSACTTSNTVVSAVVASVSGQQTRTCQDLNNCGVTTGKPALTQACTASCTPSWVTSPWSTCNNNIQTRTVTDSNNCGLTTGKPITSQTCTATTTPPIDEPTITPKPYFPVTIEAKNIFFDEATSTTFSNAELVTNKDLAYQGERLAKMKISDRYHPYSRICGPDVSFGMPGADTLSFFLRIPTGTYRQPLYLETFWQSGVDQSQTLPLNQYFKDGQLTDTWQRVLIPRSALQGNFNGTFRCFTIKVDSANSPSVPSLLIDTITLENRQGLSIEKVETLDNRHVMLTVDKEPDMTKARDPKIYSLVDSSGKTIAVEKVGFRTWIDRFVGDNPSSPIIKYYIYLSLVQPLSSGQTYNLTADILNKLGQNLPIKNNISFTTDFVTGLSSSIKINQVGYSPTGTKIAYIGNYLGDADEMTVTATTAYVVNVSNNQNVFSGNLVKASQPDNLGKDGIFSGEEVWTLNFSSFQIPGQYYIYVPGVGRSYNFRIANDVYNDVFYKAARSLMYQRSDINLDNSVAGIWARSAEPVNGPDGKPRVGYIHNSIKEMSPLMWDETTEAPGAYRDMSGGWYDAADYSHYVKTAYRSLNYLLTMFEIAPQNFKDGQLNLPGNESRNGVPDYLDNVKWEADWLAKMIPANGCVPAILAYDHWPRTMPAQETGKMWAITKSTETTAGTAGALAQASRLLAPYLPEVAANYKAKALLAYSCLEKFPTQYPVIPSAGDSGKYCNPTGSPALGIPSLGSNGCYYGYNQQASEDLNARIMAAIEMYRLIGDSKYNETFKTLLPLKDVWGWVGNSYYIDSINMVQAYSYYLEPKADSAWKKMIKDRIISIANVYNNQTNAWRYAMVLKSLSNIGFGTFTSATYSYNYILAYLVSGDSQYLNKAKLALDPALGANPLSQSFMTGVGSKLVKEPISNLSEYDGIVEPVPGYTIFGPGHGMTYKGFYKAVIDYSYPSFRTNNDPNLRSYPAGRKYVDSQNTTYFGEYSINTLAATAAVYGYFLKP